ncbi:hypothetical protein [Halorientalis pallida]|uniref:hypothetical protein n=1 Tax=Halorientalis pallida TaxID=2479928 RepID=UPI00187D194A|nr:hypothetical protein [Halorientalis pallida]
MSEDTDGRCTGFEVGNGDYIVCNPDNAHEWIRSDTAVALDGRERERDSSTRPR